MLDSIYTSATGLQSFAKGLDVLSTNVTNVNTVGFKATSLSYRDIHYRFDARDEKGQTLYGTHIGGGVAADVTTTLFNQGDLRQTNGDTDAAISGRGFFIVQVDGGYAYTRNGQFEFNENGDLVTRDGGRRVMGLGSDGSLRPVNENPLKAQPSVPTTYVDFTGNLVTGSSAAATTTNISVIDSLGGTHAFKMTLTADTANATPRTWKVSISDEKNAVVGTGSIAFTNIGAPATGTNAVAFNYQAPGADAQNIVFRFGEAGSFAGVTSFSTGTTSNVVAAGTDGRAQGSLISITFDAKGRLSATYSNQQTATGMQLALADFDNLQALIQSGGGLYRAQPDQRADIGAASTGTRGSIVARNVESSNVDLSGQFADMIVIQRGYQASSQMLTVANELLQQLLEAGKK